VVQSTGTGNIGTAFTLDSTSNTGGHKHSLISTGTTAAAQAGTLAFYDSTADAYRMVVSPTGNVGIGTLSPFANLSVKGANTTAGVRNFEIADSASTTLFSLDNAGTAYFSGSVGIGTVSPGEKLGVNGNIIANGALTLSSSGVTTYTSPLGSSIGTKINVPNFDPGAFGQIIAAGLPSTAAVSARVLSLLDARTVAHQPTLAVFAPDEANLIGFSWEGSNTTAFVKTTGGDIGFRSNTTDLMTLLSSGNVGISTTSPWRTLSVAGTVAMNGLTSSATGNALCITPGKEVTDAGGASCVPSSIRFKENVETLAQGFALDELTKLRAVSFDYKDGAYSPEDLKGSYGMIAEEVEKIDPKLVDYGYDNKPLTLKFEKFVGLFVQAIQELVARVTGLEDEIHAQKSEIENQKALIEALKTRVDALDGQASLSPTPAPMSAPEDPVVSPEPTPEPPSPVEEPASPPEDVVPPVIPPTDPSPTPEPVSDPLPITP
jgi:hypothetical protein